MRHAIRTQILLLTFVVTAMLQVVGADEVAPEKTEEKVYVIFTRGGSLESGGGVVLTGLTKEDFFGVVCLTGRGLSSYMKGISVRLPVENIVMIMEYESEEAWGKSVRDYIGPDNK